MKIRKILNSILNDWPEKFEEEIINSFVSQSCKFGTFVIDDITYVWAVDKSTMRQIVFQRLRSFIIYPVFDYIEDIIHEAINNIISEYGLYYLTFGFDGNFEETKDGILYYQKEVKDGK